MFRPFYLSIVTRKGLPMQTERGSGRENSHQQGAQSTNNQQDP